MSKCSVTKLAFCSHLGLMSTRVRATSAERISARKEPTQERAAATRDAILQAAARILSAEGLSAFNTNRVAEVAGVSIGSLYQYYPNKAALLAALSEQHTASLVQLIEACVARTEGAKLEPAVDALIDIALEHQFEHAEFSAALDYAERELPMDAIMKPYKKAVVAELVELLSRYPKRIPVPLRDAAIDVMTIVQSMIDSAALRGESNGRALKQRVTRAVLGYLLYRVR